MTFTDSLQTMGDRALRFARPPEWTARALFERLRAVSGVVDVVVTEEHVLVVFARAPEPETLAAALTAPASEHTTTAPREHRIEVRYDGADLESVAQHLRLSVDAVVELHENATYEVKTIGFMPGFAYLGDVDPRLVLPRRETPRVRVPARSVAIAGPYTAVYPFASSGGWHLLGTAPDFVPFALALGDRVRFERSP